MGTSELFRLALRALRAHTLRSFLTLLGVIIGVMTIVGVVGIISGLDTFVKEKVIILSPDVFILQKFGIIRGREEFIQALKRPPLTFQDFEALQNANLPRVATVGIGAGRGVAAKCGDRRLEDAILIGTNQRTGSMFNWDFELPSGRWFTDNEDVAAQPVAVIGANVKDELFPRVEAVGRIFQVNGLSFRVVGVLAKEGRSIGFNQDQRIYVPIQVYRKNFAASNESMEIYVKARGGIPGLDPALDEVRSFLRATRHTGFRDPDPFGVITQESLQDLWRQISSATFLLMGLISTVSLGVGGIVIMNIMLVSVAERTSEIGIRRALGARKSHIRRQFLLEAGLLAAAGGLLGVLMGGAIAGSVRLLAGFPAEVTPAIVAMSLLLSTCVGLLAGLLPAGRAANLVVIDAIRAE
jgi:putative ABC transport system permease protein